MSVTLQARDLRAIPLFAGVSEDRLGWVRERLHRRHYGAGVHIVTACEVGTAAYIVISGTVKVYMDREDGTSVILAILGPGEIVGDMSLVDLLGRSATVITLEDTEVLSIDAAAFRACIRDIPGVAVNLATILSRRLRLANEQILALGTLDVYGRVARQIQVLAHEYGEPVTDGTLIPIRLTQHDLADLVGASRVRVNQALGSLKRHGVISVDQRYRIVVHEPGALADQSA
ncbi:MAG TPA: Crp/Fnr family transcriptional regulator [Chloroflexota bacterium]|nr:Crp/Fnr family transcriptional regulator [Chloroflexota bacterium]